MRENLVDGNRPWVTDASDLSATIHAPKINTLTEDDQEMLPADGIRRGRFLVGRQNFKYPTNDYGDIDPKFGKGREREF